MTDKIKKLESLTEDVQPEFPTLSRGGYVEDTVDDWLSNHLREVNEIIKYQNYGVDVVDALESALEEAQGRISDLEGAAGLVQVNVDSAEELEALRAELTASRSELAAAQAAFEARIKELESAPIGEFPSGASETVQASILLQHATQLGSQYVEKAKADGEQIRHDAEAALVELRGEIEDLEAQRFATFRSLDDFFSQELTKLRENNLFAQESGNSEVAGEEDLAGEEDVTVDEIPVDTAQEVVIVNPVVDAETEDEAPILDDEEDELETSDFLEEDEDSEGVSK